MTIVTSDFHLLLDVAFSMPEAMRQLLPILANARKVIQGQPHENKATECGACGQKWSPERIPIALARFDIIQGTVFRDFPKTKIVTALLCGPCCLKHGTEAAGIAARAMLEAIGHTDITVKSISEGTETAQ